MSLWAPCASSARPSGPSGCMSGAALAAAARSPCSTASPVCVPTACRLIAGACAAAVIAVLVFALLSVVSALRFAGVPAAGAPASPDAPPHAPTRRASADSARDPGDASRAARLRDHFFAFEKSCARTSPAPFLPVISSL